MKVSKSISVLAALVVGVCVAPAQAELPAALKSAVGAKVLSDQDASLVRGGAAQISTWGSFEYNSSVVQGALVQFAGANANVIAGGSNSAYVSVSGNADNITGAWARSSGGSFKSLNISGGASGDIHVSGGTVSPYLRGAGTISFQQTGGVFAQGTHGPFSYVGGGARSLDDHLGNPNAVKVFTDGGKFLNQTATGAGTFRVR